MDLINCLAQLEASDLSREVIDSIHAHVSDMQATLDFYSKRKNYYPAVIRDKRETLALSVADPTKPAQTCLDNLKN